ncbi:MAG: FAD-dependent oxidoreductase [Bacteroidales bacterium]|nr:FAD-dependent oxidoreductase [Bacteroidales bacterium]
MAIIRKYKSSIVSVENKIEGVYTLELSSQNSGYKYTPGQFLHLSLDKNYDGIGQWPESRCFSIRSNPTEQNIKITYAVKGRFTKMMERRLKDGSEVWLKLPYGDLFSRPHNRNKTIFIAGGTGITPFLSLFTHKSFTEYSKPNIYLGFRSDDYNIYKPELRHICNLQPYIQYWLQDVNGPIDIQKVFEENGPDPDYFISGPPDMIRSFRSYLIAVKVPENQIKTDDWE